jgi:hypothetical protein
MTPPPADSWSVDFMPRWLGGILGCDGCGPAGRTSKETTTADASGVGVGESVELPLTPRSEETLKL